MVFGREGSTRPDIGVSAPKVLQRKSLQNQPESSRLSPFLLDIFIKLPVLYFFHLFNSLKELIKKSELTIKDSFINVLYNH
jgi:hypothetical protein